MVPHCWKAEFETFGHHFGFSMGGLHSACVDRVQEAKLQSRKVRSIHPYNLAQCEGLIVHKKKMPEHQQRNISSVRSSLTPGVEAVVMEMVSSEFY
jgi:hypothetical protein